MKNRLTYFLTRASMFGIGYFLMFKNAGKDAWIAIILGTLIGIMILFIYKYIKEFFRQINIREVLSKTTFGKIYLLLFLLFYLYLICVILIILPMFVNSFYLLYTPKLIVVIPFLLLALYITHKEKRVIETLSNLLCVFSVIIILTYVLFLLKYIDFSNLVPVYTVKSTSIIKASLIYASISSIPQLVTINYTYTSFKDDLKNYLLASLTTFIIISCIILTLGEPLIHIYSFPEYALLKQIKILDFIENIENLSTFIWYFDLFIALSSLVTNIKETLPKEYNKVSLFIISLIILLIATKIIGQNYRIIITVFYTYPYVLGIFLFIFISFAIYMKYSKKLKQIKNTLVENN